MLTRYINPQMEQFRVAVAITIGANNGFSSTATMQISSGPSMIRILHFLVLIIFFSRMIRIFLFFTGGKDCDESSQMPFQKPTAHGTVLSLANAVDSHSSEGQEGLASFVKA